jgi:hypothetical protein
MSKARGLADLGNAYDDGALSNRNLIINGAMQVAQRGTSVTGVTTNGYRTCDRMEINVSNLGTYTLTQESDGPDGFSNSLKIDCTTADASPASSDYVFLAHKIEGQNLQHLKKGTANALPVTVSFWVKSNMTGTYQFNARDNDNVRYVSATYTVNAADTWEYKTLTLAGDTTGALDNDANESLKLEWWLDSGSNFNSGSTNTSWAAASNANRNSSTTVNIGDSTSNYFQITGVQLEVGDTATPFEHRSYGDELARCQRYYETGHHASYGYGAHTGGGYCQRSTNVDYKVEKRAVPTTTTGAGNLGVSSYTDMHRYYYFTASSVNTFFDVNTTWTADAEL